MTELDFGPEARARWMPPADELRRLGHEVVELLVEHLAGDDERRAFRPYPNDRARALLDEPLPESGEDAAAVLAQRSWLESKLSEGGTALARVREQLERARAVVGA